jgi:hypothetical protein
VAEQHEPEADDQCQDGRDGGVPCTLREARQDGGGSVRIDGVIVDNGSERVGHGAYIGRFRELR